MRIGLESAFSKAGRLREHEVGAWRRPIQGTGPSPGGEVGEGEGVGRGGWEGEGGRHCIIWATHSGMSSALIRLNEQREGAGCRNGRGGMIWARACGVTIGPWRFGVDQRIGRLPSQDEGGGGWESVLCLFPTLGARGGGVRAHALAVGGSACDCCEKADPLSAVRRSSSLLVHIRTCRGSIRRQGLLFLRQFPQLLLLPCSTCSSTSGTHFLNPEHQGQQTASQGLINTSHSLPKLPSVRLPIQVQTDGCGARRERQGRTRWLGPPNPLRDNPNSHAQFLRTPRGPLI